MQESILATEHYGRGRLRRIDTSVSALIVQESYRCYVLAIVILVAFTVVADSQINVKMLVDRVRWDTAPRAEAVFWLIAVF